jgi:hypothetical protein
MRPANRRRRDRALGLPIEHPEPFTVKVCCNGKRQRIAFDGKHLHLLDHPELARDMALVEFGSDCRCLEVR